MSLCETAKTIYLPTWRRVLLEWLGWDESRYESWITGWQSDLSNECSMFFHEDEWHYILPLLVHDDLATRLAGQRTHHMYNDLAHLMHEELDRAIRGIPRCYPIQEPGFDWDAAKSRAEEVLHGYGHDIPDRSYFTSYEMRIRARPGQC